MKKFEILEHRADLKIRFFGRTKEELFEDALLAMNEGLKPKTKLLAKKTKRTIKIASSDLSLLLVDFLSEVLYLTQVNKEVYEISKFINFTNSELEAELIGKKVESFGEDIKAVTYHGLDVQQTENGTWQATILFDV